MAGRGVHFALTSDELSALRVAPADDLGDYVSAEIETDKFGTDDACETDKSWSYIHAALNETDPDGPLAVMHAAPAPPRDGVLSRLFGSRASSEAGLSDPGDARFAISGQEEILSDDAYYIGLVEADHVGRVASSLSALSAEDIARRVVAMHRRFKAEGNSGEAATYATGWYPGLVEFYERAAASGKHVIFSVDF